MVVSWALTMIQLSVLIEWTSQLQRMKARHAGGVTFCGLLAQQALFLEENPCFDVAQMIQRVHAGPT
jgi:hypothetical protein